MNSDSVHRLVKSLVDSGEAESFEQAYDIFSQYGIKVTVDKSVMNNVTDQAILLTVLNISSRCFIGNVHIESKDFDINVQGFNGWSLTEYINWLGIQAVCIEGKSQWPTISIGKHVPNSIYPWADGWSYGTGSRRKSDQYFAPACIAAAALSVNEAFSMMRNDNPYAGHRSIDLCLWNLSRSDENPISPLEYTRPDKLWLVGLGHLGQAYAWILGLMTPGPLPIYLQDIDCVTDSNISTSMLCTFTDVGRKKTRVVADWLEKRGYNVSLVERRFTENQLIDTSEPDTALFGVDNAATRRTIEQAGYRTVIDAGLGSGYSDYKGFRIRTFPGPSQAARLWASNHNHNDLFMAPAYNHMLKDGADQCGVTTLANKAVGAPFVGCMAAAYVISEYIKGRNGMNGVGYIDGNLRDPERIEVA